LLLDEVHKIGGEEELNFLRTLIGHPNEGIREKARSFHNELEQKKLGTSREEDIGTKLVPTKPNGAHLKGGLDTLDTKNRGAAQYYGNKLIHYKNRPALF